MGFHNRHEILYNPNKKEFKTFLDNAEVGRIKGIIDRNGNVYLADAYYLQHDDIWKRTKTEEEYKEDYYIGDFELSAFNDEVIYSGDVKWLNERLPFLMEFDIKFPEDI